MHSQNGPSRWSIERHGELVTEHPLFLYRAFISHCATDALIGRRLAHALSRYKVPASLSGRATHLGKAPTQLTPIFTRPGDQCSRALPVDVIHALFGSQFLIVIATRASESDEQVNKEIRMFKHFHGENRILYIETEAPGQKHLPLAARFGVDADGASTDRNAHPGQIIEWDGRNQSAFEKIVAYLLGISFVDLREAQSKAGRANRAKWAIIGATALALLSKQYWPSESLNVLRPSIATEAAKATVLSGSAPVLALSSTNEVWQGFPAPIASFNPGPKKTERLTFQDARPRLQAVIASRSSYRTFSLEKNRRSARKIRAF